MSLLVVGLSHHSAPIHLLERVAVDGDGARELATAAVASRGAHEVLVLATCNRLELYAEVPSFHAGVRHLSAAVSEVSGVALDDLADHLYFHHGQRAVEHLFSVASGLDSMALGESQVLGQVRAALRRGQEDATLGRSLQGLVQQALRVGKRVHSETGLDRAGVSLVEAGLASAEEFAGDLSGLRGLVIGAGSMSALAATTLARRGVGHLTVANRTRARAERLAGQLGGDWVELSDVQGLGRAIAEADVIVSCTGATGTVLDASFVEVAHRARVAAARPGARPGARSGAGHAGTDQLVIDLALPHDVDLAVARIPGVSLVGLADLRSRLADAELDVQAARDIVADEVAAVLSQRRADAVGPTVAALRRHARGVVDSELDRLRQRVRRYDLDIDPRLGGEVDLAVHRIVEKLLHTPTVRVKELAADSADGISYAAALRELFDLPEDVPGVPGVAVADVLRVDDAAVSTVAALRAAEGPA